MKKIKYIILLMIINLADCTVNNLFGQLQSFIITDKGEKIILKDYDSAAEVAMQNNNFEQALKEYFKRLNESRNIVHGPDSLTFFSEFYYYISCAYSGLGLQDSAIFYLKMSQSFLNNMDLFYSKFYENLCNNKNFKKLKENSLKKIKETNPDYDIKLMDIIAQMKFNDQLYRGRTESNPDSINIEFENYLSLMQSSLDSINSIAFEKMIRKYGWPDNSKVGPLYNDLYIILQHLPLEIQIQCCEILKNKSNVGYGEKIMQAYLDDRIRVQKGEKQIYGTQLFLNENKSYEFYPIENENEVNKRRSSVGLEPIEDYAMQFGIYIINY